MPRFLVVSLVASCTLALTSLGSDPARASEPPAHLAPALDAWAKPLLDAGLLSGNLLVAHDDSILLERSWGMADKEAGLASAPDLPSNVASITKPITVILAIQLMEAEKLGYTDPLSRWIPDFPMGDSITIEHLLRHRAGIPHRLTKEEDENRPYTAADMVELAKGATLTHKPGAESAYSSGNFSVLARVLELASGMNYGELARTRIFEPLGMAHTFHPDANAPAGPRATGYAPVYQGLERQPEKDYSFLVGAGSLFSTARDIFKVLYANVTGYFGAGARLSALRGSKVAWNGSTNGFRAFADHDTLTGYSVVFTGNLHSGAVDQMRAAVHALLAGVTPEPPAMPPAQAAKVPPGVLASYEGRYDIANNPRLAVKAVPYGLDVNGWAMVATGDSMFFSLRDFATVKAIGGGKGPIERFDWTLNGQTWPCPRVGELEE